MQHGHQAGRERPQFRERDRGGVPSTQDTWSRLEQLHLAKAPARSVGRHFTTTKQVILTLKSTNLTIVKKTCILRILKHALESVRSVLLVPALIP